MWIESHQSLLRHRKTNAAKRALGCDRFKLIGHLHALWWWALDNAPEGQPLADYEIVDGAEWDGNPQLFVESLSEAGFLDALPDGGYLIHDWQDFAGKLIDRRRAAVKRTREWRQKQQATAESLEPVMRNVTHNVDIPYAPVIADRTVPNRTVPNQDSPSESRAPVPAPLTTPTEREVLNRLKAVKNYPFDLSKDLERIRELSVEYPTVDMLTAVKKLADYWLDNPIAAKGKSNPRLRLRNWIENESRWVASRGNYRQAEQARLPANGYMNDVPDLETVMRRQRERKYD